MRYGEGDVAAQVGCKLGWVGVGWAERMDGMLSTCVPLTPPPLSTVDSLLIWSDGIAE